MTTIYFVRHGEAEVNVAQTFGAENTGLTERGRQQAHTLAERCSKLSIDCVIVSTMMRAQETASFISERTHIPLVSSELFEERKRPTSLIGKQRDDPQATRLHIQWIDSFFIENKRFEDGENFLDMKARAAKALSFLEMRSEVNILVVMHGFMLRTILARIIFGEALLPQELYMVMRAFNISNVGITVATLDPSQESERPYPKGKWRILTWNDLAHLG